MSKVFLLSVVMLLCSFDGSCNSLDFTKNPAGEGYIIRGSVDPHMIEPTKMGFWGRFYVLFHETGRNYWTYTDNSLLCPDNAEGAAAFINKRLSNGVRTSKLELYNDNGTPWTAIVLCMSNDTTSWRMSTLISTPPGSAKCTINYPAIVSFGNVTIGAVKDINHEINISCDASADVKVSLTKDTVKLGDAEMNYYFPGNKKSYQVSVSQNSPANFNVRFSLEKTGSTLGYKTGDAVMLFSWL